MMKTGRRGPNLLLDPMGQVSSFRDGTIEFFLLYVEINFSLRVYVKNKLMWILVHEDELGLVKIFVKSKGFLQKCQNNG